MEWGGMDHGSAALALEFLLQDSKALLGEASQNGPDWKLALRLQQQEIENHSEAFKDWRMSHSLDQAVRDDADALVAAVAQERVELEDRREACRLGGVAPPPLPIRPPPTALVPIELPYAGPAPVAPVSLKRKSGDREDSDEDEESRQSKKPRLDPENGDAASLCTVSQILSVVLIWKGCFPIGPNEKS